MPASLLLAQHKERASQLENQIEKQKQNVKPAAIFSTGILMVSAHAHTHTHTFTVAINWEKLFTLSKNAIPVR